MRGLRSVHHGLEAQQATPAGVTIQAPSVTDIPRIERTFDVSECSVEDLVCRTSALVGSVTALATAIDRNVVSVRNLLGPNEPLSSL